MNDAEILSCADVNLQIPRLRAIMHRLRAPGGCPWDAEQTHESLIPNLIEEAYETIDAIQRGDDEHFREELGDLLLQVVFHSELASENGSFNLDKVAQTICEKLIRRHPHVFAISNEITAAAVLLQWDEIKRKEKGQVGQEVAPYLADVGKGLPALLRAAKLQKKAAKVGFDWPSEDGVLAKIIEECGELRIAAANGVSSEIEDELGDLLFSVVNFARHRKIDPEILMARANDKFEKRFDQMEAFLASEGIGLHSATNEQMETAWETIKRR